MTRPNQLRRQKQGYRWHVQEARFHRLRAQYARQVELFDGDIRSAAQRMDWHKSQQRFHERRAARAAA